MKVTNWRKKLAATLVATGALSPVAARAANLDTNLVANPGFENVDGSAGMTGTYGAPRILNWTGAGFAYSHDGSSTNVGVVPDYADGADPPNAGHWYFSANNAPGTPTGDIRLPDVFYQDIDVSAGATATKIATGEAAYNLSAYMSSYLNDNDFGNIRVEFRNAGGSLGFAQISDSDPGRNNVWSLNSGAGLVPVGTATLRVSAFGTAVNGGSDAYIDNVDVRLRNAADTLIFLEANTTTGQVSLKNQTGSALHLDYYEITSATGALKANTWTSLQDQNLAGFPAGNGSGNGWEEAGGSSAAVLSESYLTGNSTVSSPAAVGLGPAFNTAGAHDLVFRYSVVPQVPLTADFDADGDVDGGDFLAWQRGVGIATGATQAQGDANADGAVNAADLALLKTQFGKSPFRGAGVLQFGFVRYVTGAATAVPESSTIFLAGVGLAAFAVARRSSCQN